MKKNILISVLLVLFLSGITSAQVSPGGDTTILAPPPNGNTPDEVYTMTEEAASYVGGQQAMIKFIQYNAKMPYRCVNYGECGSAFISFNIEKDGTLSEIKVHRSSGYEHIDEEGLRVVQLMPKWNPAKLNGVPVRTRMMIPITFEEVE